LSQQSEFTRFVQAYPDYSATGVIDELRSKEYARLDQQSHVYLDYTGGGLYSEQQLTDHFRMLHSGVFGNPHSVNPTSTAMTELVDRARQFVYSFFNASEDDYFVIFTPNASAALKHVGESFPFQASSRFVLSADNHNSVNGIREFARSRGASTTYLPLIADSLRLEPEETSRILQTRDPAVRNLFAFPGQSNFSGVQHPLSLIEQAQSLGWDVLLDAAAFVPTNRLDLSKHKPEFVSMSFYKMFGYPTGVGCLMMRKPMLDKLVRPWFAGGTVRIVTAQGDGHYMASDEAAFEIEIGLKHIERIGIDTIHERVSCLTGWLLDVLTQLRHSNGMPLVHIHGPEDLSARGGTVSMNLCDVDGALFDIRRVEELASEQRISLRTGCFCNPGAGEFAHQLSKAEISQFFEQQDGMSFDQLRIKIRDCYGKEVGAIRVSVGIASTFEDVDRFLQFARAFIDKRAADIGDTARSQSPDVLQRDSA